jgi:SWI/SNF-related matrix-associated actin-dependent regulator of chromatin subfamily B protein 1
MRPYSVNADTYAIEKIPNLHPGMKVPAGWKFVYSPRLRCNDCPGKLYTALPGSVEGDFEVHLRNRNHRERVEKRMREEGT